MTIALCPPCARDDAGWRDAPMSVVDGGIYFLDNGSHNTLRATLERREYRVRQYYELVRRQRTLIARQCAEQHGSPIQLDLFEVAA